MVVFSDLDGSLLDHDTYDWRPARPALEILRKRDIPLVLVSSKTLAELADYRVQLQLRHPVVAENGAAMDVPADYFPGSTMLSTATISRDQLQTVYNEVKVANEFRCQAFYELGVPGIVRETGLTERKAMRANDRKASEPILWLDSEERAALFSQEMQARGLRCTRGGRFLHLMADTGKDEAVRQLIDAYMRKWPGTTLTSVSLGDGPNDLGMLASTDIAVVIPGKHEHRMSLTTQKRVLRPTSPGPVGWNEAMLTLLAEQQDVQRATHKDGE
ncbi:MAG: HAD-IIB family hydrolase [Woeseia sp.]|nr:HAD-IIB family hydrolase [Woeseia sp.]MBT8096221.1 HAD-IIB family hydrolase [Woeseia sp.]NNE61462.1 HAD-IIB family hydrolase [Woeseia sp.]NNL56090.1 HAD-IIB family hydrolase [Woeseia sp.]